MARGSKKPEGRPRDAKGRPLLPDGRPDPDPSCYTVRRTAPGAFAIAHYLDPDDEKPCCRMEIRRSANDIVTARFQGIDVDIATLKRAPDCVRQIRKAVGQ